ncbi:hypothetical protein RRG08_037966 [Elysia crispata]|uniref:Uncharacterized protein n=1 Tax=Elysia crispata TaxID=231223 RepID=A0AAE1ABS3_9GAST|nr:hypothetical protein RRG08_037966 [Elysia crispata]
MEDDDGTESKRVYHSAGASYLSSGGKKAIDINQKTENKTRQSDNPMTLIQSFRTSTHRTQAKTGQTQRHWSSLLTATCSPHVMSRYKLELGGF